MTTDRHIRFAQALPLLLLLTISACQSRTSGSGENGDAPPLPYRLDTPGNSFKLAPELREISGLSMAPGGRSLITLNDEEGVVYYLDPATGAVENSRAFEGKGDFEGIEAAGGDIYAVKSNGTLYRIPESGAVEKYPTRLNGDNNVEGLCYDAAHNRLLLACKGKPGKNGEYPGKKAVYAFDLATRTLNDVPVYLIDAGEIMRRKNSSTGFAEKLHEAFDAGFSPSGLAFNPLDSNLYVVASAGKALAVLGPGGGVVRVESLELPHFRQPEGICFDSAGNLFISSEGGKHEGRIFRFSPVK